jgi:MoxR-like ATPase
MNALDLVKKYSGIRTGQDMIDAGIVPKTPSEMLTLITYRRLVGLRDVISATLDEKLVGKWVPAIESSNGQYNLRKGVSTDERLGWKIKFKADYTGSKWDKDGDPIPTAIPAETIGNMRAYDEDKKSQILTISFDKPLGGKKLFKFKLEDIADVLDVSSIGGVVPTDREDMIFEQAMYEFFPKAKLDTDRTERALIGMLMPEKDMIYIGPPGSGKSTLARDIVGTLMQQGIRFEVENCRFGCNPYSLFDEEFAKKCPPCSDCMEKRTGNPKIKFKDTGIFVPPRAKDVPVTIVKFGPGHGVTYIESTKSTRRRHLAGEKIPKLDGTTDEEREDLRSMEGFNPGSLASSHNGICHVEEIDKLNDDAQNSFLEVNTNHRMQPDEVKFELPVRNTIVATANDPTNITEPMRDRFFMLAVRYHKDLDVAQKMLKGVLHGGKSIYQEVDLKDLHIQNANVLMDIVAPITLENAIVAAFYKLRNDPILVGKSEIFGSGRAVIDAPIIARAELLRDGVFFADTPKIMDVDYAISGIQYAICARVGNNNHGQDVKMKEDFRAWVEANYPLVLKEEENKWCCDFFNKHLSVVETQVPEVQANFLQEMASYTENPKNAIRPYNLVRRAHENPSDMSIQDATITYPFMEYLFLDQQPGMRNIKQDSLLELIGYFAKTYQNSECKIDDSK